MIDIKRLKSNFRSISSIIILDYKIGEDFVYYKMVISFIDQSKLMVNEYSSRTERNYSFHWQNNNSELIVRWDNAPHHKNISTFPHHKHSDGEILLSNDISLDDILSIIDLKINL